MNVGKQIRTFFVRCVFAAVEISKSIRSRF